MPAPIQPLIESPTSEALLELCNAIRDCEIDSTVARPWPARQLNQIGEAGVYRWFVAETHGGLGWSGSDIVDGYIQLASACLTSTFVVTQRVAALRRICNSKNDRLREDLVPSLLSGKLSATVGISHLTTSRRHMKKPVLRATQLGEHDSTGFKIDGFSPWVTGAFGADFLVMGAELVGTESETDSEDQILFCIDRKTDGVTVKPGFELVGLTASQTGQVKCESVVVDGSMILAGPCPNVLAKVSGNSTGGLQTSALALGLAKSAVEFLKEQLELRTNLAQTYSALEEQFETIKGRLKQVADGVPICSNEEIRTEANSLVLRATQSALVAAKGTGYVAGHPVGRWCQEALFFLVWSCPQAVVDANLCELAGIES